MTSSRYEPRLGAPKIARIRAQLAAALLVLFSLAEATTFVMLFAGRLSISDLPVLTAALITPLVGLTSTAVGFYFGAKVGSGASDDDEHPTS